MRVFLAGASGVIGPVLVPMLVKEGHQVSAMTRTPQKIDAIEAMGADAVLCDVFDATRLRDAVVAARPDVVISHLTDLPKVFNPRKIKEAYARNDRVRGEGSENLLAAAETGGARRFVWQTVSFLTRPAGPPVLDETAPLWTDAPPPHDRTIQLHERMEQRITEHPDLEGIVLRFGFWYGPGTAFAHDGSIARQVRKRRYPVIGDGAARTQFVHVDDVAAATIAAMTNGRPGVYNITDDDPAPMREWLPQYAKALGAKPPFRAPEWLARLATNRFVVMQATRMRGASNEKAKRELDWKPKYASWREGFRTALG
jgi:nucleoside-diphosphate-sugar epimerase